MVLSRLARKGAPPTCIHRSRSAVGVTRNPIASWRKHRTQPFPSLEIARQELLQTFAGRFGQYLPGVALFLNPPLMDKDDVILDFARKARFVGHDQHGAALFSDRPHHLEDFANQFRIKYRGRFVKQ